jgi:hypothetical protein
MEFLMASIACCAGSTPEMAKKHVCITVLMRPPIPASRATLLPSMNKELRALLNQLPLHIFRKPAPHAVGSKRRIQQECSARREVSQNVTCFEKKRLVAGNEVAFVMRYVERIGRGPKRRCEMVIAPDFFES